MTTQYFTHPIGLEHETTPGHPERPDRLRAINAVLDDEMFLPLVRPEVTAADTAVFSLCHPESFLRDLEKSVPEDGHSFIDGDTSMSPKSWEATRHAVGAALQAVDGVMKGEADNAFVAMRPPGHHAEKATAMGFCLVNSIAIAARYAQQTYGLERVAIVDWDVHHGNGTQDIFYNDPSVMFASTHQMPLFPGTGAENETGVGNIHNVPLRAGDGQEHFRNAFRDRVLPAVENFSPDIILISAGFDAHYLDPLANINLQGKDFDWATGQLMELAGKYCDNRVVSLLEGGYDLQGLAESTVAHVNRLMNG